MGHVVDVLIENMVCCACIDDCTDFSINVRVVEDWWFRLVVYACLPIALFVGSRCDVDRVAVMDRSLEIVSQTQS